MYKKHPVVNRALKELSQDIPDDCVGIHGLLYNVDNFNHPGSNAFIEINKGTDITNLFETSHININLANKYLKTLKVKGAYNQVYTYDFTLYEKLRDRVYGAFFNKNRRNMRMITKFNIFIFTLFGLYYHINLLISDFNNLFNFMYYLIVSSIFNTILGGYGHNGLHRLNYSTLYLDWNGLSTTEWLLEHISSHHMYTNTKYDHDAISLMPFLNWIETPSRSFFSVKGKHLIYLIGEIVVAIQGNLIHKTRWKIISNNKYPLFLRLSPFVFIIRVISHLLIQGITTGIISLLLSLGFASYYFSYLAHLNHSNNYLSITSNKIEELVNINDFVYNQLNNTADIDIDDEYGSLILNLNKQTIHHLFPTVDHYHLNVIRNLIKNILEEYDLKVYKKSINYLNNKVNYMLKKNK